MAGKSSCDACSGLCCRYFAFPIDTPETEQDCDDIRWYLCHKNVAVFVENGDWYMSINTRCRYLFKNGRRCRIYSKRPKICRTYTARNCDYTEGSYDYELHFTSDKQIKQYIEAKFGKDAAAKPGLAYAGTRRRKSGARQPASIG